MRTALVLVVAATFSLCAVFAVLAVIVRATRWN